VVSDAGTFDLAVGEDAAAPTDASIDGGVDSPTDAGEPDPFDPDAGCGTVVLTARPAPGALLLVFDSSGSMQEAADGESGPSRWDLATQGMMDALAGLPGEMDVGLMLFPHTTGDECSVGPDAIRVGLGSLETTRGLIVSALESTSPTGGNTPIGGALRAGWAALDDFDETGRKGLLLLTDGMETCESSAAEGAAVHALAADQHASKEYLTYALGIDVENNFLSGLAANGATPRTDGCLPECTSKVCNDASECDDGLECSNQTIGGIEIPGTCQCTMDSDCPMGLTCESGGVPLRSSCEGPPNCCHHNADGGSFATDFRDALDAIAAHFLTSCTFDIPSDDVVFDPGLVNVGVTFEGEERRVLPQSSDASMDSWNYATPENDAIIIQGPICDRLLMGAAEVEIVVGCPTIII